MTIVSSKPLHSRIEIIEGLRGLAALAVAWFHFTNANPTFPTAGWLRASGTYGWLGVESFFVISGFIIPYAMWRAGYHLTAWPTFLAKRLLRLEPPYLVSIVLTLALWWMSSLSPGFTRPPPSVAQVLLHVGYLTPFFGYDWLNTAYWTLAIEFQYYLLMAVAFPLLAHKSARVRLACFVVACLLPFALPSERFVFHYLGLFALGAATFLRRSQLLTRRGYLALFGAAAGATYAVQGPLTFAVGAGTALLIAYGDRVRWRAMTTLGALSYSLYLLHGPVGGRVVNLGARYAQTSLAQLAVAVVALGVSIAAAYALHRLIERPALRLSASLRYKP